MRVLSVPPLASIHPLLDADAARESVSQRRQSAEAELDELARQMEYRRAQRARRRIGVQRPRRCSACRRFRGNVCSCGYVEGAGYAA